MMRPSHSIRAKLRFVILTTSLGVITLTAIAFVIFEFITFRRSLVEHVSSVAQMTAANSTSGLAFEDPRDAKEVLSALRLDRYINEAALYDKSNKLFARYPSEFAAELFPGAPPASGIRFENGSLVCAIQVVQDRKPLGMLYLRSDLAPMWERFQLHTIILAIVLVISSMLAW